MNKFVVSLSLVLAQVVAVSAIAQSKGEVDPNQSKAAPSAPATRGEKAAAKAERKAEGAQAARTHKPGDAEPASLGTAKKYTKAERAAARQKRKAAVAPAVKKGEIPSGEIPSGGK